MGAQGHELTLRRYNRGKTIPWNRPVYGYRVVCECGFEQRVNGTKREAERAHRDHVRDVGENPPRSQAETSV